MNSLERCMTVLEHKIPDRIPVIPQDHHVAMKQYGLNHGQFHHNPELMRDSQLKYMFDMDLDGTLIGADTACLSEAVGCKVDFEDTQCPRTVSGFIEDYRQVKDLKIPDPYSAGRMPVWVEATRLIAKEVGKTHLVIGRADQGAFSLASMMRGMEDFLIDIACGEEEEGIHALLRYCNEVMWTFILALKEAGAHVVTSGDSISGPSVVNPKVYMEYSYPYEKELSRRCKEIGVYFSTHICGYTDPILEAWSDTGSDIMELDTKTDFDLARKITVGKNVLFGNIDTTLLYNGTADEVYESSRNLIECAMPHGDFILSSGCLMGENTPVANVRAMVIAAKEHGVYKK